MDEKVALYKAIANKLQREFDKKKTSESTSNQQRSLPLNRRSSDESEDLRLSTHSPLISSGGRKPSYPSTCSNSSPESPPDASTARSPNDPCNSWSDIRNSLDKISQTPPSVHASKHARKKIFKKRAKAKRVSVSSSSTASSETCESRSVSDKSPELKVPLLELHDNITDSTDRSSQTQTPKLKRKRSQDGCLPLRKFRRFNSLDESSTTSNRLLSNRGRYQVHKTMSPDSNRSISGFEIQKKKPFKRKISLDENLKPCRNVSDVFLD